MRPPGYLKRMGDVYSILDYLKSNRLDTDHWPVPRTVAAAQGQDTMTPAEYKRVKRAKKKVRTMPADTFAMQCRYSRLPMPETEYRFHPTRRWRFDFAWPAIKLAVEIDGGTWVKGRHVRGAGYARDCEKMNTAQLMGWTVFRFTSEQVRAGEAVGMIEQFINTVKIKER